MRAWREAFHREPELSNHELRTREKVVAALEELGVPSTTFGSFTGVLGSLGAGRKGPVVAVRADMDALPVTEATGLPYTSTIPGAMHACGHDVHMACALGAAAILGENGTRAPGPVKFLFQPAEEEGHRGGALPLLDRGVFDRPKVDYVIGQHVTPELPVGSIGWRAGPVYAAADDFLIRVHGRGSHAGYPHLGRDPIVVASEVVLGLQTLVSRERNPTDPAVVTVGQIHGGTRHNVIPDEVWLEGTVRTLDPATRRSTEAALKRRVRGIAQSHGVRVSVRYRHGYPATVNPPGATRAIVVGLTQEFGAGALTELDAPAMGAEDFSRYLERVPGTFLKLGAGDPPGATSLHTPRFAPPDETMVVGAAALACATVTLQENPP